MATRRYKANAEVALIVEEVGAATNSHTVEVTIDLATTAVNDKGATRQINKQEVLAALDRVKRHILKGDWGPA